MKTNFASFAVRLHQFLLACTCGIFLLACSTPTPPTATPRPTPVPVVPTEAPNGRIAVVEVGGTVYTINPDGSDRAFLDFSGVVNNAAVAWSPDSTRLALGVAGPVDGSSQLIVTDAHGRNANTIYEGPPIGVPFYLSWSPSGDHIAFLANRAAGGLSLRMIRANGSEGAVLVADGSPSFFSWSPEGRRMLLHIGAEDGLIGTYALDNSSIDRRDVAPGVFQAPAWSPAGEAYVFATRTGELAGDLILVQGSSERTLISYRGLINFTWSPDGSRLAYSLLSQGDQSFSQLTLIDMTSGASRPLTSEGLVAYYWSPDSTRLAYLTYALVSDDSSAQSSTGRDVLISNPTQDGGVLELTWHIFDIGSEQSTRLASYQPTRQFGFTLPYFDQYAQSASFWSPDGRYLLLIGSPNGLESAIYRVDTLAGAENQVERIGPGDYAIWSWK